MTPADPTASRLETVLGAVFGIVGGWLVGCRLVSGWCLRGQRQAGGKQKNGPAGKTRETMATNTGSDWPAQGG